ncbi:hypothetical protein QOM21_25225 [Streptomyces sp. Pv4-95]
MSWWQGSLAVLALLILGWCAVASLVRAGSQTFRGLHETVRRIRELFR